MIFTVCGGDLRSVYLVRRLIADCHTVQCFGLEHADLPAQCHCPDLSAAMQQTRCVILPTPTMDGGVLRTPLSSAVIVPQDLVARLPKQVPVFAGNPGTDLTELCLRRDIHLTDLLSNEALAVKNAALTAQCALQVILWEIPYTLTDCPVLILGAGRIGKLLGLKLRAMGARVTVSSRQAKDKAWCAALGLTPADTGNLAPLLPRCRILVNTIPSRVLTDAQLRLLPDSALLFELASGSGGFHPGDSGLNVIACGGLPGKYAPQSAADAIVETIYELLER